MRRSLRFVCLLGIVAISFAAGAWFRGRGAQPGRAAAGHIPTRYVCPMHPGFTSDWPGKAPCCGMELVPLAADGAAPANGRSIVNVSADIGKLLGVRVEPARAGSGSHTFRTSGRVAADENRLFRLNASTDFWVRKVYPATTGSLVREGEPLLGYYAGNYFSAAASYMYALNTRDRQTEAKEGSAQREPGGLQLRQAVATLRNLGVSELDIEEMARTRKPPDLVTLRSPSDGIVLFRIATRGQWIASSTELYQIADLSHVWILADLFENEARNLRPGMIATVRQRQRDLTFNARVSAVPPIWEAATRTLKVRLEAANPGLVLRPDMFVDVEFPVRLGPGITVPADAVIDSGRTKTVYVETRPGVFEPRHVETGWRSGERIEIRNGLEAGEKVVASGTFLIDSESRMRLSARSRAVKDPVCGMDVDPAKAAAKSEYKGTMYYFCSGHCQREFDAAPGGVKEPQARMRF